MEVIIALVVAIAIAFAAEPAIKRFPVVWYVIIVILDVVYLTHVLAQVSPALDRALYAYFNRGLLAFGFLAVVMFIGVFGNSSKIRRYLTPIRGELSIMGALLCLPHIVNYLLIYIRRMLAGFESIVNNIVVSFFIALVVTVILAILTVTSFNRIRKAMTPAKWKKLQKWAYPFFILLYVHIVVALSGSITSVGSKAFWSLVFYTVITVAYVVLRLLKVQRDRKAEAARTSGREARAE